jgi:hypothetical protein
MVRHAIPPLEVAPRAHRPMGLVSRADQLAERAGLIGRDGAPPGVGPQSSLQHEPGGELVNKLVHPQFTTLEREWRVQPNEAIFSSAVTPNSPLQFTVGAYRVPNGMALWLEDYAFAVMMPDATDPFGFRYQEPGRFGGSVGFDLSVNDQRGQDLAYQIDPVPTPLARQEYDRAEQAPTPSLASPLGGVVVNPARRDFFDRAAANSFGSTSATGNAMMPPRMRVAGPRTRSFVWPIPENTSIAVRCTIIRPIHVPIYGFYAMIAGHSMHVNVHNSLVERLRVR